MTVCNMDYSVGSRIIIIHDDINNIDFKTWLLYPSSDESQCTKVGPFKCVSSCIRGLIKKRSIGLSQGRYGNSKPIENYRSSGPPFTNYIMIGNRIK